MSSKSRSEQIAGMPSEFAMCRVLVGNHVPASGYPVIHRTRDGGYEQMFACANCGTEVYRYRDRHGFLTGKRSYRYPAGYLLPDGGQMTKSEKASVFVQEAGVSGPASLKARRGRRAS
jgi:hypothetical protein